LCRDIVDVTVGAMKNGVVGGTMRELWLLIVIDGAVMKSPRIVM
jgi:hypothetical protein